MPATLGGFVEGTSVGPLEVVVERQHVLDYVYATGDFNPWYLHESPFGPAVAPPTLLTLDHPSVADKLAVDNDLALASKYEHACYGAIPIGTPLQATIRNAEAYAKRGNAYIRRELEVRGPDHELLGRSSLTEMMGPAPEGMRAALAQERASSDPLARRTSASITKAVSRKQVFVFSARDGWWRSIHTDPELAQQQGLRTAVAQGLMTTGYVSELALSRFGPPWITNGRLSITFIRPVFIEDILAVTGEFTEAGPDDAWENAGEISCINQNGEVVAAGRVSAGHNESNRRLDP